MGPSGSGKTTFLRCIEFLERADRGLLEFDDLKLDMKTAGGKEIAALRRKVGFVFQAHNLFANKTALQNVTEGLIVARKMEKKKAEDIGRAALDRVGLSDRYDFYPAELSGGQQQRVSIARALALDPEFIVCDEVVSALDLSYQSQIINLLERLQAERGLSYLFISHDLAVVRHISNRIAVMYMGRFMELADADELIDHPAHPYTKLLLRSVPVPDPGASRLRSAEIRPDGAALSPAPQAGCPFADRCGMAEDACRESVPALREIAPGHFAACRRL
jgi:oligopeptide transport system ATP-binding protein